MSNDVISLGRLNIILAALRCTLSIEPDISELLQDPNRTKAYFTEVKITLKKNYFHAALRRNFQFAFLVFHYLRYPAEFLVSCQAQQACFRNPHKN